MKYSSQPLKIVHNKKPKKHSDTSNFDRESERFYERESDKLIKDIESMVGLLFGKKTVN